MTNYLPYNPEQFNEYDFGGLPAEMQYKIIENRGVLIEITNKNKIKVKCAKNHVIRTQLIKTFIDDNKWCSACAQTKYNINDLYTHATTHNGFCLSTNYVSCADHYTWKCGSCDHIWNSTWLSVNCKQSWCPNCANSSMETICRLAIEEITKLKFPKNLDVIGAEIDCYNDDLKLGFEYDGIQHHEYVQYFHGDKDIMKFEQQLERDVIKDELCINAGIRLIRINYKINKNKLRTYIHDLIRGLNLDVELETEFISINDFNKIVAKTRTTKSEQYIATATCILESKNHKLISTSCYSRTSDLEVVCNIGHKYLTNIDNISRDRGCATCSGKTEITDERIKQLIESKGYTYISRRTDISTNGRKYHYIKFECNNPIKHHIVDVVWDNINRPNKICPDCSGINIAQKQSENRMAKEVEKMEKSPKTRFYNEAKSIGYELNMDTYSVKYEQATVTCIKGGHIFAMLPRTFRYDGSNLEYCAQCILNNDFPNLTVLGEINYLEYDAQKKISVKCVCGYNDIISETNLRINTKCCDDDKCRFHKCKSLDRNKNKLLNKPKTVEYMEAEVIKYNELNKKSKIEHIQELANEYVLYNEYLIPGGNYAAKLYVKFICPNKHEFMCSKFRLKRHPNYEFCSQCIIKDSFPFLSYAEEFNFLDPKLENKNIKLICQCTPNRTFTWTNQHICKLDSACNLKMCKFKTDPKYQRNIFKTIKPVQSVQTVESVDSVKSENSSSI